MSKKDTGLTVSETSLLFTRVFWDLFRLFASYRSAMRIKDAILFGDEYICYCCPRCNISLDREFISFCDRCGQKLDWTKYRQAKLKHPLSEHKHPPGKASPRQGDKLWP